MLVRPRGRREKEAIMHAVVVTVTLQPGREQESADHLNANVIPRVKEAPGLVAGYWAQLSGAHGSSMVIFETEKLHGRLPRWFPRGCPTSSSSIPSRSARLSVRSKAQVRRSKAITFLVVRACRRADHHKMPPGLAAPPVANAG